MGKYIIDGVDYPGVTTILGELAKGDGLKQWAVNMAIEYIESFLNKNDKPMPIYAMGDILQKAKFEWKNISEKAKDVGSEVHHWIENFIKNPHEVIQESLPPEKEVANGIKAFLKWDQENIKRWINSEQEVVCKEFGYAGTLDAIAELKDGKICVIDFKTCNLYDKKGKKYSVYFDSILQIAPYKYAYTTNAECIATDGMGILRLDKKTGENDYTDVSDKYERSIEAFHYLVKYYYAAKTRRLKGNEFVK